MDDRDNRVDRGHGAPGAGDAPDDHGARGSRGDAHGHGEADLEQLRRLDRALEGGQTGHDVAGIIIAAVLIAVLIWTVVYGWAWWLGVLCVAGLGVLAWRARRRRPPVAPLELTAAERERVRRVLDEHGVRPAVALVRALYPGEPTSAAVKTVRLIADRG